MSGKTGDSDNLNTKSCAPSGLLTFGFGLALFIVLKPAAVDFVGPEFLSLTYAVGLWTVGLVALILYIRFIHIDVAGVFIFFLSGIVALSTLLNGGDLGLWLKRWPACVVAVLLTSVGCRLGLKELLQGVFSATLLLSLANLFSILLYPDGLFASLLTEQSGNFLLGHRNNVYQVIIPSVGCGFLLGVISDKRFIMGGIAAFVIGALQLMLAFSATSTIGLAIMGLFLVLMPLRVVRNICNIVSFVGAYLLFFIGVVFLRLQGLAAPLIEGILGKQITLTGRTYIWDKAFSLIKEGDAIFGCGISAYRQLKIDGLAYAHAHNELLNLMLIGGVASVAALCFYVAYVAKRMFKRRSTRAAALVSLMIGAFLIIAFTEVVDCPTFFFALSLGGCIPMNDNA